jgi:hypothetical protein
MNILKIFTIVAKIQKVHDEIDDLIRYVRNTLKGEVAVEVDRRLDEIRADLKGILK